MLPFDLRQGFPHSVARAPPGVERPPQPADERRTIVTPLDLDLPLSVTPAMVSPTRLLLESQLAGALSDDDAIFRVAMTAHELLENAAKYASDGRARLRVQVAEGAAGGGAEVRVTLTNRSTPEHIDVLRAAIAEMDDSDPQTHYFALMRRNAKIGSISRLGLARVRAEGEMDIVVRIEGEAVTIVASTLIRAA
jgi:hypothetical protein